MKYNLLDNKKKEKLYTFLQVKIVRPKMSLAHLHMTYAAAASNPQNSRLMFNQNLAMPSFHSSVTLPTSTPFTNPHHHHHHHQLLNNSVAAATLQQQYHHNYLNYQHQYHSHQQQQQQHQASNHVQRSNFAIHDLLGLNKNDNSIQQNSADISPSSSSQSPSLNSPEIHSSIKPPSPSNSFTYQPDDKDTKKSKNMLINEAACAAAVAYGAYFSRNGLIGNFSNSTKCNSATLNPQENALNSQKSMKQSLSSSQMNATRQSLNSDLSEDDNENLNEEESFGKWVTIFNVGS